MKNQQIVVDLSKSDNIVVNCEQCAKNFNVTDLAVITHSPPQLRGGTLIFFSVHCPDCFEDNQKSGYGGAYCISNPKTLNFKFKKERRRSRSQRTLLDNFADIAAEGTEV